MRQALGFLAVGFTVIFVQAVQAKPSPAQTAAPLPSGGSNAPVDVTADQSLEWYQDQNLYVARGNAKAVRGDMTVEADILTAHEREKPKTAPGQASAPKVKANANGTGDIDKMTAEGNVRITTTRAHIYGEHGVYDLDQHVAWLTGKNLKYVTDDEVVTAKDSLEYWEDKKLAVARGDAVAIRGDRHVEGDVLTAQFRDMPNGKSQLQTLTGLGHVTVITGNNISRGERVVYDVNRNIAILTGHVRITRADGTQLAGDVGEVDFAKNQSRLLNEGSGRVHALLPSRSGPRTGAAAAPKTSAAQPQNAAKNTANAALTAH